MAAGAGHPDRRAPPGMGSSRCRRIDPRHRAHVGGSGGCVRAPRPPRVGGLSRGASTVSLQHLAFPPARELSRRWAAVGSALFFALAPLVVAGLVPWWLTSWRIETPLPLWGPVRVVGSLLTLAAGALLR